MSLQGCKILYEVTSYRMTEMTAAFSGGHPSGSVLYFGRLDRSAERIIHRPADNWFVNHTAQPF